MLIERRLEILSHKTTEILLELTFPSDQLGRVGIFSSKSTSAIEFKYFAVMITGGRGA